MRQTTLCVHCLGRDTARFQVCPRTGALALECTGCYRAADVKTLQRFIDREGHLFPGAAEALALVIDWMRSCPLRVLRRAPRDRKTRRQRLNRRMDANGGVYRGYRGPTL